LRDDWRITAIGEACDIVNGGTPKTGVSANWGGQHMWITPAEMGGRSDPYVRETDRQLTDVGLLAANLLPPHSVILSSRAPIGYLVINKVPMATNQGCKGLVPKSDLDHKYLFYYLSSIVGLLNDLGTGATFKELSSGKLKEVSIPLPPLPEQQRMVAILDEAFAGLTTATANAEKNLKNARELFASYLQTAFDQTKPFNLAAAAPTECSLNWRGASKPNSTDSTRTGGRAPTTRHIEGKRSLCVGMPKTAPRGGWGWIALDSLARMESGHTPSRRHPEYWGGNIPWIGIRDAKAAHGREIFETLENTNALGLENSSARLLPAQTVCLSRTASVGYVTVMGRPMATSQDFVNWVCSNKLYPPFLMYLFLAQGDEIFRFSSGAVHQTIYFPEAKAFHICCPTINEQYKIVEVLDALHEKTEKLEEFYERKIADLQELKRSILQNAFSGELSAKAPSIVSFPSHEASNSKRDTAIMLALAYERHKRQNRDKSLGHTKEQKILHMIEAEAGFDLGRKPIRDAAGPNDFQHMLDAEDWAEANQYFKVSKRDNGGYQFRPLTRFGELLRFAKSIDPATRKNVEHVIDVFIPMNKQEAAIFATVYAAWNNLLIEGKMPTDNEIIRAAREEWHSSKLDIPREKFIEELRRVRASKFIPQGQGKFVPPPAQGQLAL
jgi:type I restriction enzyme S subunit